MIQPVDSYVRDKEMKYRIINWLGAVTAGILSSLSVLIYNQVSYHNLVEHRETSLPNATEICTHIADYAVCFPLVCFVIGIVAIKKESELTLAIVSQISLVFAIVWPVLLISLWQVPRMLM